MKVVGIISGGKGVWLNSLIMAFLLFLRHRKPDCQVECLVCNGIDGECLRDISSKTTNSECIACFSEALEYMLWSGIRFEKISNYEQVIDKDSILLVIEDDPILNLLRSGKEFIKLKFDYPSRTLFAIGRNTIAQIDYLIDFVDLLPNDVSKWPKEFTNELDKLYSLIKT